MLKTIKMRYIIFTLGLGLMGTLMACSEDEGDDGMVPTELTADAGSSQTVKLESMVSLNGSASISDGTTFLWTALAPDGSSVSLFGADTQTPSFRASQTGTYTATLTVTADGNSATSDVEITANNVTYSQLDQMGRPGINTVFNFFGDATVKDGFNLQLPKDGSQNAAAFKGIFDALQNYIFLDPVSYSNVLGLDNTTTASVLGIDVLNCNKNAPSTYGPSNLSNIVLFENVLNGRRLQDDVIDVTLILAFFGDGNTGNAVVPGVISDNVGANDVSFSDTFPYLASPH